MAFIDRVNSKGVEGNLQTVKIDKVVQGDAGEYAVIIDRISRMYPFPGLLKRCCHLRYGCNKQPFLVECRREILQ